jgi:hypothetical protein
MVFWTAARADGDGVLELQQQRIEMKQEQTKRCLEYAARSHGWHFGTAARA